MSNPVVYEGEYNLEECLWALIRGKETLIDDLRDQVKELESLNSSLVKALNQLASDWSKR